MDLPQPLASLAEVLARRGEPALPETGRRAAAVLVPLFHRDGELRLLVTRRTDTVRTHKRQVAFPGGGVHADDASLLDTALREAHEEVGIEPGVVMPIGALRPFNTRVSDFVLYPFCAYITEPDPVFVPQPTEVDEVLELPLDKVRHRSARKRGLVPGFARLVPIPLPYYKVNGTVVWGASGAVLHDLLQALDEADANS